MAYTGLQREREPLVRRIARKRLLPALVFGPALAISLCNPLAAFAAEGSGYEDAAAAAQPQVVYTEDIFSTNADFARGAAVTASVASPQAAIDQGCSQVPPVVEVAAPAAESCEASSEIAAKDSNSFAVGGAESAAPRQSETVQELTVFENNDAREAELPGPISSVLSQSVVQGGSEGVVRYESHEAYITFSAGEGGSVARITNNGSDSSDSAQQGQNTSSDDENTITEYFTDSLVGASSGAKAVADDGFHFVKWVDADTGNTLSTSENFIPARPEEGWPYRWFIQAVFAADVYQVRLDLNGGKSAGGGGSGGPIAFDVVPGSDFKLPANGTDFTIAKVGSAFSGWNTAKDPEKAVGSTPLAIEDAATFDSELEEWLQRLGWLNLDWSTNGSNPVVILYAQWAPGQSTITYRATEGGAISAGSSASSVVDGIATETINAASGIHYSDSTLYGPQGATANASSRHHFVVWDVSGSPQSLADSEAANNVLSAGTASRIARYAEYTGIPEEYHAVTFTAQFAPNAYSFIYEGNGGEGSVASTGVTYGRSARVASAGLSRSGYTLSGWGLDASGSGTTIALGQTIDDALLDSLISAGLLSDANGAQATLYAQWDADGSAVEPEDPTPDPDPDPDPDPGNGGDDPVDPNPGSDEPGTGGATDDTPKDTGSGSAVKEPEKTPVKVVDTPVVVTVPAVAEEPAAEEPAFAGFSLPEILGVISAATHDASDDEATASPAESIVSTVIAAAVPAGTLAAADRIANGGSPIVVGGSVEGAYGDGSADDALSQFATPEAMQAAGTTVAAVATVGAVAGLVGVGVSVAGAAAAGATAIGTSGAVALTTAADLAADLAASAAGAGAAGAARRRKEEEAEEEAADHEPQS